MNIEPFDNMGVDFPDFESLNIKDSIINKLLKSKFNFLFNED